MIERQKVDTVRCVGQVAIPLIKLTSKKVTYLYDLMDAAYDAQRIEETSREFGHVPIVDRNGRGKEVVPMAPHEAERYTIRSCAERANSRLKEDFGASNVMVKGHFTNHSALFFPKTAGAERFPADQTGDRHCRFL